MILNSKPSRLTDWLKTNTDRLAAADVPSARLDCLLILEHSLKQDRSWLLAHPDYTLDQPTLHQLDTMIGRRTKREPLAYILGQKDFYGLKLEVTRATLIPRPETEELVSQAIGLAPNNANLLEIGTGSGAIAVALATHRPDLKLIATDISAPALEIARRNAAKYSMDDIDFKQADLMNDINNDFEVIITNLPYVPSRRQLAAELASEPSLALFAGHDGLDLYRRLFKQLAGRRLPSWLILEAEPSQANLLEQIAGLNGFKAAERVNYCYIFQPIKRS